MNPSLFFRHYLEAWAHLVRINKLHLFPIRVDGVSVNGYIWEVPRF